jgi:competence protein ComEC
LHDLGIRDIPLLVLTHEQLDHVAGIAGVFRQRRVHRVLITTLPEPAAGYQLMMATLRERGLTPETATAGMGVDVGSTHLAVLGPRRDFVGTRSDPNNSSVVMIATIHQKRIMLAGDAEVEAQDDLLTSGVDLHADVLKVPHHGSAYSDPAFLAAVHPSLAIISVGAHNDYGHPSPLMIAELGRLGVPVLRTDKDGDIAVVEQAHRLVPVVRSVVRATMAACRPPPMLLR